MDVKEKANDIVADFKKQSVYSNPNTVAHFLDKYSQVCSNFAHSTRNFNLYTNNRVIMIFAK